MKWKKNDINSQQSNTNEMKKKNIVFVCFIWHAMTTTPNIKWKTFKFLKIFEIPKSCKCCEFKCWTWPFKILVKNMIFFRMIVTWSSMLVNLSNNICQWSVVHSNSQISYIFFHSAFDKLPKNSQTKLCVTQIRMHKLV